MIPKVYKRIPNEDYSLTQIPVSKSIDVNLPTVNHGQFQKNITPVGSIEAENDLVNTSGVYYSVHWHSVKHQYYKLPKFSLITRENVMKPDLFLKSLPPPTTTFVMGNTYNIVLRICEINDVATKEPIQIFLPAMSGMSLSYNPSLTHVAIQGNPNLEVDNTKLSFTEFTYPDQAKIFTINTILKNSEILTAFSLTPTTSAFTGNFNVNMLPNANNDSVSTNNSTSISFTVPFA